VAGDGAGGAGREHAEAIPLLAGRGLVAGAPAAYVCRDFTCRMPVTDPVELRAALDYPAPAPAGQWRQRGSGASGAVMPGGVKMPSGAVMPGGREYSPALATGRQRRCRAACGSPVPTPAPACPP